MTRNTLHIFNETKVRMPRKKMTEIYNKLLKKKQTLIVIGTTNAHSCKLNKTYREKNKSTNVLSFPAKEGPAEIYINMPMAKKEAQKQNIPLTQHMLFLYIHGILHLLGHRHGKKMETLEDTYASKYV